MLRLRSKTRTRMAFAPLASCALATSHNAARALRHRLYGSIKAHRNERSETSARNDGEGENNGGEEEAKKSVIAWRRHGEKSAVAAHSCKQRKWRQYLKRNRKQRRKTGITQPRHHEKAAMAWRRKISAASKSEEASAREINGVMAKGEKRMVWRKARQRNVSINKRHISAGEIVMASAYRQQHMEAKRNNGSTPTLCMLSSSSLTRWRSASA